MTRQRLVSLLGAAAWLLAGIVVCAAVAALDHTRRDNTGPCISMTCTGLEEP